MSDPGLGDRRPLLALILLSPILAEMLSGSSPPVEWLNPVGVLFLVWLYGSGVLVARETAVRWRCGWAGLVVLGAAYGIIEEGLAVKSFFDPTWVDLGALGWYGRWLDTNWIWAVWLTLYHAMFSIAIPIFLVEWRWPSVRSRPLATGRGYAAAIGLLGLATIFFNFALTPYRPSALHLLGALVAVGFLAWAARSWAGRIWGRFPSGRPPSRRVYAALGFAFVALSFLVYGGGTWLGGVPALTVLEGGLLLLAALLFLRRIAGEPRSARHRFAFVAGATGFFVAFSFFLELAGNRGMGAVGAAFAVLLILLYRRAIPEEPAEPVQIEAFAQPAELPLRP